MADTNIITVSNDEYVDLNTLSGIVSGTGIVVTNCGTKDVMIYISSTQPPSGSIGLPLSADYRSSSFQTTIDSGENTVWAICKDLNVSGKVTVEAS